MTEHCLPSGGASHEWWNVVSRVMECCFTSGGASHKRCGVVSRVVEHLASDGAVRQVKEHLTSDERCLTSEGASHEWQCVSRVAEHHERRSLL